MKISYDTETGKVINAYADDIKVSHAYVEIGEAEWNDLSAHKENLYVVDGEVVNIEGTPRYIAMKAEEVAKELSEQLYQLKASVAYGGIKLNDAYIFETNATSILMTTTKYLDLVSDQSQTAVSHWKCYDLEGKPAFINFTREQFITIKNFATNMINTDCFGIEDKYTKILHEATIYNLTDTEWVANFKMQAIAEMKAVDTSLDIGELQLG